LTHRYSFFDVVREGLTANRGWRPAWRNPTLKKSYDVVVIGGGGHGLATAYFLAKKHGVPRVALLERGWIGGGNSGQNTQVVRSNYFYPVSSSFHNHSLTIYEGLGQELNFNVMLRQHGQIALAHSPHELEIIRRWANAICMNGVDAEVLSEVEIRKLVPLLNVHSRYPIVGGLMQPRAGIARRDAVVWGIALEVQPPFEPNTDHDIGRSCDVALLFFEDTLTKRLEKQRSDDGDAGHLGAVAMTAGVLGDLKT